MTLKEARKRIEQLDNDIDFQINEYERIFGKTQPQSIDTSKVNVKGGTRVERFLQFVQEDEEKGISKILIDKQEEKQNLEKWVETELKILGKYHDLVKQVVYYKEDYIPSKYEEVTWYFISRKVHASESTCKRPYRKWKNKRNIEN